MAPTPIDPAARPLPTSSLYLCDALSQSGLVENWERRRTGPFSFRFGHHLVVVRYARGEDLEAVRAAKTEGGSVLYVVDDDLAAIAEAPGVPKDYAERVRDFIEGPWLDLAASVDEVVVSSPVLHAPNIRPTWPFPDWSRA